MLEGIVNKLFVPKQVLAVSATLRGEGLVMQVMELSLKNKKIEKGKGYPDLVGPETILVESKDIPVVLSLSGKGIISRKMRIATDEDDRAVMQKILPGSDLKDFYLQKTAATDGHTFVTVCRRSALDDITATFSAAGHKVIAVTLGPFALADLQPMLQQSTIVIEGHELVFQDGFLTELNFTDNPSQNIFNVAGEAIEEKTLLAFAAGIKFFTGSTVSGSPESLIVHEGHNDTVQKGLYKVLLQGSLGLFLIVLLINFLVFQNQYRKNQELTLAISANQAQIDQYERLKTKYEKSSEFLGKEGWLEVSKSAFYADQIGASVPAEIQLTELSIYPLRNEKNKAEDKRPEFTANMLRIKGRAKESTIVNDWMNELKKLEWIDDVKIDLYKQEKESSAGLFDLIINLK